MIGQGPTARVAGLLGQFTTLQDKLKAAIEQISKQRENTVIKIRTLQYQVQEQHEAIEQANNAIKGIDKLLSGE